MAGFSFVGLVGNGKPFLLGEKKGMEWEMLMKWSEVIFIPVIGFLFKQIKSVENDVKAVREALREHEIFAANNYATTAAVIRIEDKIDEVKDLLIRMEHKK